MIVFLTMTTMMVLTSAMASFVCPSRPIFLTGTTFHTPKVAPRRHLSFALCSFSHNNNNNNNNEDHHLYNDFEEEEDHGFMEEDLRRRIDEMDETHEQSSLLPYDFFHVEEKEPESVHIILFNPDTEREGVHTIEYPKGSGHNVILAFESLKDCERFSNILREQHFFDPTPQVIKLKFFQSYCDSIGVTVQVVPEGMDLKPPKDIVDELGMNPDLEKEQKLLDGLFAMSAADENGVMAGSSFSSKKKKKTDGLHGGAWE